MMPLSSNYDLTKEWLGGVYMVTLYKNPQSKATCRVAVLSVDYFPQLHQQRSYNEFISGWNVSFHLKC